MALGTLFLPEQTRFPTLHKNVQWPIVNWMDVDGQDCQDTDDPDGGCLSNNCSGLL